MEKDKIWSKHVNSKFSKLVAGAGGNNTHTLRSEMFLVTFFILKLSMKWPARFHNTMQIHNMLCETNNIMTHIPHI